MQILDPSKHALTSIDAEGTRKFEAFLDRNFPQWREQNCHDTTAGTVRRAFVAGVDDVERVAVYRGDFVEIYDQCFDKNDVTGEIEMLPGKNWICAIDGDLTAVAVWPK
jgi:hypothetical protein